MKQLKYIFIFMIIFLSSGCFKNNTMEDINIHTTAYPIEYVVERLYGEHSTIKSIFPNGSVQGDVVSDKLLQDYSTTNLFIFNGLGANELDYVKKMLDYNKNLKIIDVASSVVYNNKVEELWLDPMNLLTIANNIQKGFNEYIDNTYLTNDINDSYILLKQDLIKLDADYREMARRANRSTIVVSDDMFLYLQKYDITVISLEENSKLTKKNIHVVIEMINNGDIKYIYTVKDSEINETIKSIQKQTNVEIIELHDLYKLTEEEFNKEETYFTLMRNNLELLKNQLYN